jgi:7-keto-8-aminopelargonate synthetase-like enzyme
MKVGWSLASDKTIAPTTTSSSLKMESKPRNTLEKALLKRLDARYLKSTLRQLTIAVSESVDFSSNDFLSLSTSPTLREAFISELAQHPNFPLGSGGSRLLDGNSEYALKLENEIATFHGARAGLLWNSGFDANAGVFACIPQPGDIILHDELIHASVHDGMKLSRAARKISFKHNSIEHLRRIIQALKEDDVLVGKGPKNVFVAVESIYSMDGDLCPLRELVETIEDVLPYGNGHVIVDEAHATGVLGPRGRGLVSQLGLEGRVFARLHTFGKGVGASGGELHVGLGLLVNDMLTKVCSNCAMLSTSAVIFDQLRPAAYIHDIHAIHQPCRHQSLVLAPSVRCHGTCKFPFPSTHHICLYSPVLS